MPLLGSNSAVNRLIVILVILREMVGTSPQPVSLRPQLDPTKAIAQLFHGEKSLSSRNAAAGRLGA